MLGDKLGRLLVLAFVLVGMTQMGAAYDWNKVDFTFDEEKTFNQPNYLMPGYYDGSSYGGSVWSNSELFKGDLSQKTVDSTSGYSYTGETGSAFAYHDGNIYAIADGDTNTDIIRFDSFTDSSPTKIKDNISTNNLGGLAYHKGNFYIAQQTSGNPLYKYDLSSDTLETVNSSLAYGYTGLQVLDGDLVGFAGQASPDEIHELSFSDGSINQVIYTFASSNSGNDYGMVISPDENKMVIGTADGSGILRYWDVTGFNTAPQFDSTSTDPSPPQLGENLSYFAEVSDPDGTVDYTNLSVERTNQSSPSPVLIDSFEDGDYTTSPAWTEFLTGGGSASVVSTESWDGSDSLRMSTDGAGDNNYYGLETGLAQPDKLTKYSVYVKPNDLNGQRTFIIGTDGYAQIILDDSGNINYRTDQETTPTQFGSYSAGSWYKLEISYNPSVDSVDFKVYDSSGSVVAEAMDKGFTSSGSPSMQFRIRDTTASVSNTFFDFVRSVEEVQPVTVVNDVQRSGTNTPEWNDLFKVQNDWSGGWLNATYEVVDDQGASTTAQLDYLLTDEAPTVSLNDPQNQTYFKYDVPVDFSVSDSDSNPGEDWNCDIDKDGQLYEEVYLKEGTNSSYSGTVRSDLGSHNVNVSCTDGAGNTDSQGVDYTVENFELESTSANAQSYETFNESFTASVTAGEMVNNVETELYYDNNVEDTETTELNSFSSFSQVLYHEIPLVSTNQTSKNWKTSTHVTYTGFNGNSQTETVNSSTKSQEVLWSYYLRDSYFSPDNKYIETEDFKHNAEIHTETKKASLSGTTTYKRDSETDQMEEVISDPAQTTLQGSLDTGLAESFNQSTFQAESEVEIQFNGDTRIITTGNEGLEVYKIQLFDTANPGSLTTSETLVFDVDYEEEGYDTATRLTMDLSVWKNEDEKIRRFQFQEPAAETHTYHIYPSWAEYTIQTKPYPEITQFDLIQYFNQDTGKVRRSYFFPVPQQINNDTTTVPLKTINGTEATAIDFEVTESGGQPAENTYCRVDRKFGGGDFETVFMIKTGGQGKSQSFAEVNEIYYSFTCYKNGEVIEKFPAQIMQNPMILNLGETETETSLDYSDQFDASCTNNETSLTCEYQSQTESLEQAVLEVDRKEVVTDITVCNKTSDTATGSLTCSGLNTSKHNYAYSIYGEYNDGIKAFGDSGVTGDTGSQHGISGIFITLIIFVFVYAATAFNVPLGIALGTLSMLFSSLAGFLALTPAMRATLIGLAIVAGLVSRR